MSHMSGDSASCSFLNARAGGPTQELHEEQRERVQPSNGSRVPAAIFVVVMLDITAVGLVIPLLARYAADAGGGPVLYGVLQVDQFGLAHPTRPHRDALVRLAG